MNRSYKYRLYPSEKDKEELEKHLDLCRQVYNHFLEKLNERDEIPSRYELQKQLPKLKEKWTELKQVHSKVLQMVLKQLYDNLSSLSERKKNGYKVGNLRYKGEGWFKTIEYNQSGFKLKKTDNRLDRLKLSKIGKLPIRLHREVEGKVKGVILKRDSAGDWHAIFQTEQETGEQSSTDSENVEAVGIDLGIQKFIVDSDGNRIEHPKNVEKAEKRLKREQRNLSRKDKGSNNYKKQRKKVAQLHKTVKNRRMDFLHKLSNAYVRNYDKIVLEDLNISDMVQGEINSKNTTDSAWRTFIQLLLYKAESANTEVVLVDPKDTSKECSQCGVKTDKKLWQREHSCPSCGYTTDRDYNAAQNILGKGQAEVTPAETGTSTDNFRDVSASSVIETGSPFRSETAAGSSQSFNNNGVIPMSSGERKKQAGLEENDSQQQFYQRRLMNKLKQWADRDEIFAIKGPRQSGKTTLLKMFKQWLIEEENVAQDHIIFLTFEDLETRDDFATDPQQFIESYLVDQDRYFFLLDEFHYIEEGGNKLKLLYDTLENAKFLITSSSSLELKNETSKHLVGRLFSFQLYPFSFWEFLNAKSKRLRKIYEKKNQEVMEFIEDGKSFESEELISKNKLEKELSSYLRFGSYPEVVKARERETKEMIIKNMFNTYITRDIIELLEIHESSKVKKLVTALSSQLGGMTNYNDLSSTCETYYKKIKRFMNILEETYVLEVIKPYHKNVKTELKKNPKVYFVDSGLRNYAIDNFSELEKREDRGELVENFVLNQLKRKELGELHYWRTQGKAEVDFILSKGENLLPIEVKYREMGDLKIHSGLKSFISSYNPERALVVTKNLQGSLDYKGTDVKFVPAVCI